jgi:hypothetical protein
LFGFYFLRTVDRKYSNLIDSAVPTLNDLQTLTALSMAAMRSTNPTLFDESPRHRAELLEQARAAFQREVDLRNKILKRDWLSVDTPERRNFKDAGEGFTQAATPVINLLESSSGAQAGRQREQLLRPAFDRYVAATTKAADVLEERSLRTSGALTAGTVSISKMMLGLASWPVMLLGVFLAIIALFLIGILLKVTFSPNES